MDKFYLITNGKKDKDFKISNMVMDYLKSHGKSCNCQPINMAPDRTYSYTDVSIIPEDVECFIVLGGDGTLIQAARDTVDRKIPFVGINLGTLGYLAEVDKESILPTLDSLMKGDFTVENRMMLTGRVYRKNELIVEDIALNDIVITRSGSLRVIRFKVYVNGEFLNLYTADGIIYSTPTGSTAYNLSAGGPIISPNASMIIMTPICPHTLHSRSIVFGSDDEIVVELEKGARSNGQAAAFDGDKVIPLKSGDRIEISKASMEVRMIKLNKISFFQNLRKKMADV